MEDIKDKLRKLKPFIGSKADALWVRYQSADLRERGQWQTTINLLADKFGVDTVEEQIVLPPLNREEAQGDLPLGSIKYLDHPSYDFSLRLPELTRHLGIFGSTGTGKTTLARNLLAQLIKKDIPFIVFDWERSYRDMAKLSPKIKVFTIGSDLSPFFFNYLKVPPGMTYQAYVKNVIEVFSRAYVGGVGSDSVLLKVFDQAYLEHGTPTGEDARRILAGSMKGNKLRGREMLWKQSSLRMLEFLSYGGTGRIYNVTKFHPLEELLDDFVVFELGALASPQDKRFFVEMFTLWYWLYKEHQGIEDERLKHVLLFEEFHNIVDNSGKDDLIQRIFRQIRKYGTGLVIIDQTPSLIPNPIFENLHTKISFSLNHQRNVSAVAQAMNMPRQESHFLGMLKTGQAICRLMHRYAYPFLIEVPWHEQPQLVADREVRERMRDSYQLSGSNSPALPTQGSVRNSPQEFIPSPLERIFLADLASHPFDGSQQRAKRLGLSARDATALQNNLETNGIVQSLILDRKKLFEMTPSGLALAKRLGIKIEPAGHQGLEHRYYVEMIRQTYLQKGWFTFKERDDLDLVLERDDQVIALEIETGSNKTGQTLKNLEKLARLGAQQKHVIATNQVALTRLAAIMDKADVPNKESLRLSLARDFLKSRPPQ